MSKGNKHLNSFASDEHDAEEYRKRVAFYSDGNTTSYEDTSFEEGNSPLVIDAGTDLGRTAHGGYIANDGAGDIKIEFSKNGTDYGGQHTLKANEIMDLSNLSFKKIRLSWVSNSSYRVLIT